VTAECTPQHLVLTDEAVRTLDPNVKMNPPLRAERDRVDGRLRSGAGDATGREIGRLLWERVRALPSVVSATWGFPVPFDTYGRGLRIYVDGVRTPVYRANVAFRAIEVTPEELSRALAHLRARWRHTYGLVEAG